VPAGLRLGDAENKTVVIACWPTPWPLNFDRELRRAVPKSESVV
jgi:hypothetical protein